MKEEPLAAHNVLIDPWVFKLLPKKMSGYILDVGCGSGLWGFHLRVRLPEADIIGIDIWRPYLVKLKKMRIYDGLILADGAHCPIRTGSIRLGIGIAILTHIKKEKAFYLLNELERACQHIIVSAPLGFIEQNAKENPFQKHLSSWSLNDLKSRGYYVKIIPRIFPPRWSLLFFAKLRQIIVRLILRKNIADEFIAWK